MMDDDFLGVVQEKCEAARKRAEAFRQAAEEAEEEVRQMEATLANITVKAEHDAFNERAGLHRR